MTIYATVSKDDYSSSDSTAGVSPSPTDFEFSNAPSNNNNGSPMPVRGLRGKVFPLSANASAVKVAVVSNSTPLPSGQQKYGERDRPSVRATDAQRAAATYHANANREKESQGAPVSFPAPSPTVFRPRPRLNKSAFTNAAKPTSPSAKSSPVARAGLKRNSSTGSTGSASSSGSKRLKTASGSSSYDPNQHPSHPYPYSHYPGHYPYPYAHYPYYPPGPHAPSSHPPVTAHAHSTHPDHPPAARPPHAHAPPPPHGYAYPYPPPPPHMYPPYYPPHYYHHHPQGQGYPPHKAKGSAEDLKKKQKNEPNKKRKASPRKTKPALPLKFLAPPQEELSQPKPETKVEGTVVERRSRKNAQSRFRANKLKLSISSIQAKDPKERTPEEFKKLALYEERRLRKNGRSRVRALERKKLFNSVSSKSEEAWTNDEKDFMKSTLVAKFKKNEGDRLRRKRMRENGDAMSVSTGQSLMGSYVQDGPPEHVFSSTVAPQTTQPVPHTLHDTARDANDEHQYDDDDQFEPEFFEMALANDRDPMTHFIFPRSPHHERTYLHSPTLELCAETSILDQSLEDIAYSPRHMNIHTPNPAQTQVEIQGQNHEAFTQPRLTSPLNLSLLNLPRRSRPQESLYTDAFGSDLPTGGDMEAIAVSFSMDTL